jgi:hypothetical protein
VTTLKPLASQGFDVDNLDAAIDLYYEKGWTDGLPIVPPTELKVARFVEASGRDADDVVGIYPTRKRTIRVEKVAINAVMAGCKPEYFPVVLALIEAMCAEGFGVHGANASTGSMALGFIVNGPVRNAIDMNYRGNVMGPGNRANSTIGRAVRLTQINVMGSVPGAGNEGEAGRPVLDRSTMGQPGKYAGYHIVENEEDFPDLLPLHVERGYRPDESVVTIFPTSGHIQVSAHSEHGADLIVDTIAHYLIGAGKLGSKFCVVVVPPECAEYFVKDGWSKADVRRALFEKTSRTVAWARENGWTPTGGPIDPRGGPVLPGDEDKAVSIAASPDDILLVLAGGPAGAFIHCIVPYGGTVESQLIRI